MKRILSFGVAAALMLLTACGGDSDINSNAPAAESYEDATVITLSDDGVTAEGPNAQGVSTANDIVYYEAGRDFTYGEGTAADEHSAEEAAAHTVVHITRAGAYRLTGTLSAGQIAVDLGENAEDDPNAVVTLVLDGVDITCTVAPAVMFYNVYECGNTNPDKASAVVNTQGAGANVVLAADSDNVVSGSYVARIYKSVELNEAGTEVINSKKLHKYDGAFYSRQSMNVSGEGRLTIHGDNEGLDTECHLTINGGTIVIRSGNDGINTNEDGVSVVTINGGNVDITVTGRTGEGDGIDSNGWLVINGGHVVARACGSSMDSGVDADMGIQLKGGSVIATGNMTDRMEGDYQAFRLQTVPAGTAVTFKNEAGEVVDTFTGENAYSNLVLFGEQYAEVASLWSGDTEISIADGGFGGMGPGGFGGGQRPEGMEPPEGFDPNNMPEGFGGGQRPEGMEPPEGFDPEQMPGGIPDRIPPEGFEGMEPPAGFEGRQS